MDKINNKTSVYSCESNMASFHNCLLLKSWKCKTYIHVKMQVKPHKVCGRVRNSCLANFPFLQPLKMLENQRFFGVFRGIELKH